LWVNYFPCCLGRQNNHCKQKKAGPYSSISFPKDSDGYNFLLQHADSLANSGLLRVTKQDNSYLLTPPYPFLMRKIAEKFMVSHPDILAAISVSVLNKGRAFEWILSFELARSTSPLYDIIGIRKNGLFPMNWKIPDMNQTGWEDIVTAAESHRFCIVPEGTDVNTQNTGNHKVDVVVPLYASETETDTNNVAGWVFVQCAAKDMSVTNQDTTNSKKARDFYKAATNATADFDLPKYFVYASHYEFRNVTRNMDKYPGLIIIQGSDFDKSPLPFATLEDTSTCHSIADYVNLVKTLGVVFKAVGAIDDADIFERAAKQQKLN